MSDLKLNQIFIAHPVAFVSASIKKFAENLGVSVFVLDNLNDFRYLIEDLKPQAIIVHEEIWESNKESFNREIKGITDLSVILIQKSDKDNGVKFIQEPFEPLELTKKIKYLLESESKSH